MAEGAPLLREYGVNALSRVRIPLSPPSLGSNPLWLSVLYYTVMTCAPVAQLDRVPGYELGGRRFESFRARQFSSYNQHTPDTSYYFI